ncbi:hypothetical protein BMI91_05670 [Thioclava sediminum]|uniref:Sulfotransferase domain-containing protein n=1 Tax=Thioclava sediminum TaxID=1915319 RepID=A0ABX3N2Q1_9RHOB|nr:sulfotransferase domain-containing protein [Thioclava sediminum]OOY25876.1 hypothetical protein BMI91_05670 [Thioclava sediminum]
MINKFKRRAALAMQGRRDAALSPERLQAGDTFIVEFPKSGVTWLTMLLANAFAVEHGLGERVTFGSVRRFVPDLHASRAVAPRLSPGGVGFYKSHAGFNRNYATTIYLVRHPAAVMKSYHKFRTTLDAATPADLAVFLDDPRFGIAAWKAHVGAWIIAPRDTSQRQLHLVRYEDLVADAGAVLAALNDNLGWALSEASLAEAVARSSRDAMRAQEDLYRRHNPAHRLDFVGKGEVADDAAVAAKVARACAAELARLGYTEDAA